jgi:5-methylcytosine-specific restriction endonuclease McrA
MTLIEIDERMAVLAKTERKITLEILETIRDAEASRLPEHLGYRDTYQWLIQRHKYSGGAANRRIQASRLLKDLPEVGEKVGSGSVNLSTLCKMQSVLRAQQKASGSKATVEQKREAMRGIENKTCDESERVLHTLFPGAEVGREKVVQKRDGGQRCTVELSARAVKLIDRAREILSHSMPGASMGELIERIAEEFVERNDPVIKAERLHRKKADSSKAKSANNHSMPEDQPQMTNGGGDLQNASRSTPATPQRRTASVLQRDTDAPQKETNDRGDRRINIRVISTALKHEVIRRAGGRCEYTFQDRRCSSRYQLEMDHIIPKAKGGSDETENLRCLCRNHNQMMAEREFGTGFMASKRAACLESAVLRG